MSIIKIKIWFEYIVGINCLSDFFLYVFFYIRESILPAMD